MEKLLNWQEVTDRTSLSRYMIQNLIKAGDFPPAVRITEKRVAWREKAVDEWIRQKAEGGGHDNK